MSSEKNQKYYEVALPLNIKKNLIYASPWELKAGESVFVSVRNKKRPAVILSQCSNPPPFETKPILAKDTDRAPLAPARMQWLCWLADYYHHNLGSVIHLSFPPPSAKNPRPIKKKPPPFSETAGLAQPDPNKPSLTEEQQKSLQEIQGHKGFRTHLLHGVTGSGKTEIFFRLIEPSLQEGKSALILVPEIALTPQHIKRFSHRFPQKVACFHSGLSLKEKRLQWMSLLKGEKQVLIGPRSALFCPLPRLSWIIVDEEHTGHFKQEEKLKYQGRDSAVYLAKCLNIPIVLASATPSLESWQNARTGKYLYHSLKKQVFRSPSSKIILVDMKKEKAKNHSLPSWLSGTLYSALQKTLAGGEQSALFLNRRGESTYVFCSTCSYSFSCANCDIALTQHQKSHLLCHYCGFRREKPFICPECQQGEVLSFGVGTAALQKELTGLFPSARICRADRDEIKTHKQWSKVLDQIENREVDILIGTQMIAKGLDFPHLNLVGLILADQGLNWPDFRAGEKSFQLILQMAGRAGRRSKQGQVILQSYNPSHPIIRAIINRDFEGFAQRDLKYRKKHGYPPFGRLSLVRTQSISSKKALKTAEKINQQLKHIKGLETLGPAPAPYVRLKNQYRYHLLLKSQYPAILKQAGEIIARQRSLPGVRTDINRDPNYMF